MLAAVGSEADFSRSGALQPGARWARASPPKRGSTAREPGQAGPQGIRRGGKVFRMYKFRTMYVNGNNEEERQVWAERTIPGSRLRGVSSGLFGSTSFPRCSMSSLAT